MAKVKIECPVCKKKTVIDTDKVNNICHKCGAELRKRQVPPPRPPMHAATPVPPGMRPAQRVTANRPQQQRPPVAPPPPPPMGKKEQKAAAKAAKKAKK